MQSGVGMDMGMNPMNLPIQGFNSGPAPGYFVPMPHNFGGTPMMQQNQAYYLGMDQLNNQGQFNRQDYFGNQGHFGNQDQPMGSNIPMGTGMPHTEFATPVPGPSYGDVPMMMTDESQMSSGPHMQPGPFVETDEAEPSSSNVNPVPAQGGPLNRQAPAQNQYTEWGKRICMPPLGNEPEEHHDSWLFERMKDRSLTYKAHIKSSQEAMYYQEAYSRLVVYDGVMPDPTLPCTDEAKLPYIEKLFNAILDLSNVEIKKTKRNSRGKNSRSKNARDSSQDSGNELRQKLKAFDCTINGIELELKC
jgi:hypothetical protein